MRRHDLGVFQRAAGFEVSGDASCSKRIAADLDLEAQLAGATPDQRGCLATLDDALGAADGGGRVDGYRR